MFKIDWGFGSIVASIAAAASLLTGIIPQLATDAEVLGLSPAFWVVVTAILGATVVIGRMVQRARGVQRPVGWGPASLMGYLGALAAVLTPGIADLAGTLDPVGVPNAIWVGASALLLVITTLGRMDQGSRLDRSHASMLAAELGGAGDDVPEGGSTA